MNRALPTILSGLLLISAPAAVGDCAEPADALVNFTDHIAPILKQHCTSCHGETRKKAGLDFSNYEAVLRGGSGGKVVVAGRASKSRMLELMTAENPAERMPLNGELVPAEQIAKIRDWIAEGLRESAKSGANLPEIVEFTPKDPTSGTMEPAPVPSKLPPITRVKVLRPFPVLALAAAPRAPFFAVPAYECIDFIDAATKETLGSIPFAEGEPHVLRFNRSGSLLLAAGGRPVEKGIAALIDVGTGKRLATIGDEADAALAADLSPDERQVALSGTGRVVKIYATKDGAPLHSLVKHTDWVTALAFSPDGKLLASGDRVGNIYLWDPHTGQVVLPLADHKGAIRALSWRADGKVLATCGEDGLIVWWDVAKGMPMTAQAEAHTRQRAPGEYGKIAGGVLDATFGPQGQLATCGRDYKVRVWSPAGKLLEAFSIADPAQSEPARTKIFPTRVAITADGKTVVAGDSAGRLHSWAITAK
ncbi:MAG: hypothetical protein K8U03_01170 [Planctomycetia bacterium]|nr:hypothetical protein [Planctomycetia bacterium]